MPRSSRVATTMRREDVAAELVGAEPMGGGGPGQRLRGVAGERIVRRQRGAERGAQRKQEKQRKGKGGDRVLAEHIAGMAQCRGHASSRTRGSTNP